MSDLPGQAAAPSRVGSQRAVVGEGAAVGVGGFCESGERRRVRLTDFAENSGRVCRRPVFSFLCATSVRAKRSSSFAAAVRKRRCFSGRVARARVQQPAQAWLYNELFEEQGGSGRLQARLPPMSLSERTSAPFKTA